MLRAVVIAALGLVLALAAAAAGPLRAGEGQTLVVARDGQTLAAFDRGDLDAMAQHRLQTATPWTAGTPTFTGVLLRDLLARAGLGRQAGPLTADALNAYRVRIPAADAWRHDVLVATRMNGAVMPLRRFGPYWIVYPLSAQPALDRAEIHDRMIWQLTRLEAAGR
jgi:hypothetical protein